MPDQLVYVYGPHSRVHVAVRHDGAMLTNERCQLDDVVGERVVETDRDLLPPQHELCRRCFHEAELQHDAETVTLA